MSIIDNNGAGAPLDLAGLTQIDADCARGFSAALPSHKRALKAYLAAGTGGDSSAYALALLLRVEQLLHSGMVAPSAAPVGYLDESLVLSLDQPLPAAA